MDQKITFGPIIEGTLRNQDLISAYLSELERLNPDRAHNILESYPDYKDAEEEYFDTEDADWLGETLIEALEDEAPPFVYFGSSDGDGACIGWWPQDLRDIVDFNSEVIKCDAGNEPEFILSVNDHGNVTLYQVKLEEVWSIV